MALPLAALIGASLLGAGANIYSNTRNQRAAERQAKASKEDARRAAIERAMGGTSLSRGPTIVNPPDLTIPGAIAGLSGVAGQYIDHKYKDQL